ncbi:MAG: nucleotidyltransferase family protein, partial [Ignavibacteriota bacterium]
MHAIIPVAGVGSRLRPHTFTLPKVLLNVAGKPILGHILDRLRDDGVTSATIVVGYMGNLVESYVRTRYHDLEVNFVTQDELLGLGHSIWVARDSFPPAGEPLLIILGDTIYDVDLKSVLTSPVSSLGVKIVDDPRRFGVAELSGGFISKLIEKPDNPTTNLAVVGLYFIKHPELLL